MAEIIPDDDDENIDNESAKAPPEKRPRIEQEENKVTVPQLLPTQRIPVKNWDCNERELLTKPLAYWKLEKRMLMVNKKQEDAAIDAGEHFRYLVPSVVTPKMSQSFATAWVNANRLHDYMYYPDVSPAIIARDKWVVHPKTGAHIHPWMIRNQEHMTKYNHYMQALQRSLDMGTKCTATQVDRFIDPPLYFDLPQINVWFDTGETCILQEVPMFCLGSRAGIYNNIDIRRPKGFLFMVLDLKLRF